ncbi:MAG: acetyl-CoA carboxylase biotin carboxyl carrier protein [Saprospiraceae bacterium]
MNFNEVQQLIKLVNESNLSEFKMKNKDIEVLIRTEKYHKEVKQTVISAPQMMTPLASGNPANAASTTPPVQNDTPKEVPTVETVKAKNIVEVKSPIVGTFYRSAGPDKPVFAKVGEQIKQGDVVCIIEAMKLFNEIESDSTGTIVKVCVEDASPVEYDQVLFLVEV